VIGAGGLGCEILKNLALTGFNRLEQFESTIFIQVDRHIPCSKYLSDMFYRKKDIGKSKAIVAANFVMSRVPGVQVVP